MSRLSPQERMRFELAGALAEQTKLKDESRKRLEAVAAHIKTLRKQLGESEVESDAEPMRGKQRKSGEEKPRRRMSAAARKAVGERMKKYWAERRRAK